MQSKIDINTLKEFPDSPRKATETQINIYKNILDRFGSIIPVIADKNNFVVSDYAKVEAAKQLGIKEINVISIENLTEKEVQAIRIAEARAGELGEWDYPKLFEELVKIGEDLNLAEFNLEEIESLFPENPLDLNQIEEVEIPEEEENYFSQAGDIWLLGNHRLMCGDSTKIEDVKKLVKNQAMDLMITDPPYNVNYEASNGNKIANDNMSSQKFEEFLIDFYKNAFEVMRKGAAYYVFHADSETRAFRGGLESAGFKISQCLIWVKNQFVLSRQDYNWRHEPCLYGWKEGTAHYFINDFTHDTVQELDLKSVDKYSKKELVEIIKQYQRIEETIVRENKPLRNEEHPTMKPIKLIAKLMNNSSKKDWNILDLFGGSGSTLIAAEQLGRKSFLMEYDPKYTDVIVKRYAILNKGDIKLIRDGQTFKWEEVKVNLYKE